MQIRSLNIFKVNSTPIRENNVRMLNFGEIDDGGSYDYFERSPSEKRRLENRFKEEQKQLADYADENDMSPAEYHNRRRKLEKEKEFYLRNPNVSFDD